MKPSGIGGQAVMEGVMMRNKGYYAVAVRKSDQSMVIKVNEWKSVTQKYPFLGWPLIRGSVNLIESMIVGMRTLTYSAGFFDEEDEKGKDGQKSEGLTAGAIFAAVALAILLAVVFFVFCPLLIGEAVAGLLGLSENAFFCSLLEGVIRIAIFVGYVKLISRLSDIKRVFCYHGAEHKTINCIEHGLPLTVENARKSSKEHKRCGTSFMIIVMVISILVLSVANVLIDPLCGGMGRILRILLRFGIRLLLLPFVAGISYEFLKLAGRSENRIVNLLSRPGMWMQALTTHEPDDAMLEVAIASVEAVFDWEDFLAGGTGEKPVKLGETQL